MRAQCAQYRLHNTKSRSPPPSSPLHYVAAAIPASRQSCGEGPPCWLGPTTSCPAPPQAGCTFLDRVLTDLYICRDPPRREQLVDIETNLGGGRLPAYEMITRFCSGRSLLFKSSAIVEWTKILKKAAAEAPSWNKNSELGDISVVGLERMR